MDEQTLVTLLAIALDFFERSGIDGDLAGDNFDADFSRLAASRSYRFPPPDVLASEQHHRAEEVQGIYR
jgi:hypothetical protein